MLCLAQEPTVPCNFATGNLSSNYARLFVQFVGFARGWRGRCIFAADRFRPPQHPHLDQRFAAQSFHRDQEVPLAGSFLLGKSSFFSTDQSFSLVRNTAFRRLLEILGKYRVETSRVIRNEPGVRQRCSCCRSLDPTSSGEEHFPDGCRQFHGSSKRGAGRPAVNLWLSSTTKVSERNRVS